MLHSLSSNACLHNDKIDRYSLLPLTLRSWTVLGHITLNTDVIMCKAPYHKQHLEWDRNQPHFNWSDLHWATEIPLILTSSHFHGQSLPVFPPSSLSNHPPPPPPLPYIVDGWVTHKSDTTVANVFLFQGHTRHLKTPLKPSQHLEKKREYKKGKLRFFSLISSSFVPPHLNHLDPTELKRTSS